MNLKELEQHALQSFKRKELQAQEFPRGKPRKQSFPNMEEHPLGVGELFKTEMRWRVGNGKHIRIENDPWTEREGSRKPLVVKEELKGRLCCKSY